MIKRLLISVPLFIGSFLLMQVDFSIIWRYFAWMNQTLAVFTLWALTVWLAQSRKLYMITLIPALFMTAVCTTYIFIAPEGFNLSATLSQAIGAGITFLTLLAFFYWNIQRNKRV